MYVTTYAGIARVPFNQAGNTVSNSGRIYSRYIAQSAVINWILPGRPAPKMWYQIRLGQNNR